MLTVTSSTPQFRVDELRRVLGVLGERRPAVVAIAGAPGMGKTTLLAAVLEHAEARGWRIAGGVGDERLSVGPETSERDFRRRLLADGRAARAGRAGALVDDLARRAPLLVLIDDYRPGPAFARWFEGEIVPGVLRTNTSVVVIVAQRPGGRTLATPVKTVVELAPLDPRDVRAALEELSPALAEPLTERELSLYSVHATSPVVLDSLVRVLRLPAQPAVTA